MTPTLFKTSRVNNGDYKNHLRNLEGHMFYDSRHISTSKWKNKNFRPISNIVKESLMGSSWRSFYNICFFTVLVFKIEQRITSLLQRSESEKSHSNRRPQKHLRVIIKLLQEKIKIYKLLTKNILLYNLKQFTKKK